MERADARIRTADPFITSEVLYQLSYVGEDGILAGRKPHFREGPGSGPDEGFAADRRTPFLGPLWLIQVTKRPEPANFL